MRCLLDVGRHRQQEIEKPFLHFLLGDFLHLGFPLSAHHVDRALDEIAHHRLDIAADVADLGELGRFHLDERRLRETREAPRDFGLPDAGRSDHQDVLRRDFLGELGRQLLAAHPVAQRDRNGAFGGGLTDDVLVQLGDDLPRRQGVGGGLGRFGKQDSHYNSSRTICLLV